MNIKEFEGKALFAEAGIRVPRGRVVRTPEDAVAAYGALGATGEVVLKAQVLTGKRGKSGGIAFVDEKNIHEKAQAMLGTQIRGFTVRELLIEEKLAIETELYVAITVDRRHKCMSVIASAEGGMDIEEVASLTPEKIITVPLAEMALSAPDAASLAAQLVTDPTVRAGIADVLVRLYAVMRAKDASLVEINPLIVTVSGDVIAGDSKVVIDENALFRQEHFRQELDINEDKTDLEKEALKAGFAYVELDGVIGVIGNGAGLTMTMIDLINYFGSTPANFLDIGGAARTHEMEQALTLVLKKPSVKSVCINIFGGITHCDEIAQGIIDYRAHHQITMPLVVRMVGTNVAPATIMLEREGIHVIDSLEDAVKKTIELTS